MMRCSQLPIAALPAWAKLNDVDFLDTCCKDLGAVKGFGIATSRTLSSKDVSDLPTLLIVPQDLILSTEAIEEYTKVDHHFRQLIEVAGATSLRDNVMLFLLMQITIASPEHKQNVGLSNPWTEYVKMMPTSVPVPTMWTEEERYMLTGTSLEVAVNAKMAKLQQEFDTLREQTAVIPWCTKCWWENEILQFSDWVLLDAWYRSRSLELPNSGEAMVPCLDMANHSSESVAHWEQITNNNVALLLRPGLKLGLGDEITISYGNEKSAAEFLFSYGFIDEASSNSSLVLALQPFPDDPLGKAKFQAFTQPPTVTISKHGNKVEWKSPFLYLMSLNEEDGLAFRVLQQVNGLRSPLRVFWHEKDVTEETDNFELLISDHPLKDVFKLRVLALLHDRIRQQLERLYESEEMVNTMATLAGSSHQECVLLLRKSETGILEQAFEEVDLRKKELLENETVLRYLGSMDDVGEARLDSEENEANDDEEDFS